MRSAVFKIILTVSRAKLYWSKEVLQGVFVICVQNSSKGGIFDYWGSPFSIGDSFVREIFFLIEKGKLAS